MLVRQTMIVICVIFFYVFATHTPDTETKNHKRKTVTRCTKGQKPLSSYAPNRTPNKHGNDKSNKIRASLYDMPNKAYQIDNAYNKTWRSIKLKHSQIIATWVFVYVVSVVCRVLCIV